MNAAKFLDPRDDGPPPGRTNSGPVHRSHLRAKAHNQARPRTLCWFVGRG